MIRTLTPFVLGVLLIGAALTPASAQDKSKDTFDLDEFRRLRRLESPQDFWNAIQFEVDLGKPEIAARYLRGLLAKKPTDKDLYAILDKDGLTKILTLRNVPSWSAVVKENDQAKKDVEELIKLATDANKRRLADAARIREFIAQLQGTPEEATYAINELYKIGAPAVPLMIDAYQRSKEPANRHSIVKALLRMGPATVAPMLAALDTDNASLKLDLLTVLRKRHAASSREIVPFLWYLSAAPAEQESVRNSATELLAAFQDIPASKLPTAKVALTQEAERYYDHKANFGDPRNVTIWRWDGKQLVQGWPGSTTVTASQAEEYYGQKFARQALTLDPTYQPAQVVSLSLAVEKAMEKAGPAAPISRTSPAVSELLAKANPELVIEVLEKSRKEKRTPVILAAVRALGDRAEARAKRPTKSGDPALVQALTYPDARVRLAAAIALVNIPGPPAPKTATRIVEVLTQALSPMGAGKEGRKILLALTDEDTRNKARQYVIEAGLEPIAVNNGRDAIRQLRANTNVEAILLDSTLPYPGLANLLAQMRQDVDVGRVPIILSAIPESRAARDAADQYRRLKGRVDTIYSDTRKYRDLIDSLNIGESDEKKEVDKELAKEKVPSPPEVRANAYAKIEAKYVELRSRVRKDLPTDAVLVTDIPKIQAEMQQSIARYDLESQIREAALERFVRNYANVQVVHASAFLDAASLEKTLQTALKEGGVTPSPAEQRESAEKAIEVLASLAEGKPEGYDIKPATNAILDVLKTGRLSLEGQQAAIRAANRLDGGAVQSTLALIVGDGARNTNLRIAASKALITNLQRQGVRLSAADVNNLRTLAGQAGLDTRLKDQLHNLLGAMRTSERATGESLRDYRPTPTPPLAPPKEKEKEKEKK